MNSNERIEKFEKRRAELKKMSDEELKKRFWLLCDQVVEPMVENSKTHTSPSIERSVLMRMGIDSFTAKAVVNQVSEMGLLGRGAGHAVWKLAQKKNISNEKAAKDIAENPDSLKNLF